VSDRPRFTVIVPIHDHARVVGEAIGSIRAQTVGDWELVVVDDGSTDDGAERARRTGDPRVRLRPEPSRSQLRGIRARVLRIVARHTRVERSRGSERIS